MCDRFVIVGPHQTNLEFRSCTVYMYKNIYSIASTTFLYNNEDLHVVKNKNSTLHVGNDVIHNSSSYSSSNYSSSSYSSSSSSEQIHLTEILQQKPLL